MKHPRETDLALSAGGDVSWWIRFGISRHLAACAECARLAEGFRRGRQTVKELANELPEGLNWDRLASEMKGNIRVGLAAGECVGPVRSKAIPASIGWKPAAAFACAVLLMAGGWWLNMPENDTRRLGTAIRAVWHRDDPGVSVTGNREGVEVKQNGATMTLMNPGTLPSVVTASTQGEVRARYVDADTGQVTITNVYAQ